MSITRNITIIAFTLATLTSSLLTATGTGAHSGTGATNGAGHTGHQGFGYGHHDGGDTENCTSEGTINICGRVPSFCCLKIVKLGEEGRCNIPRNQMLDASKTYTPPIADLFVRSNAINHIELSNLYITNQTTFDEMCLIPQLSLLGAGYTDGVKDGSNTAAKYSWINNPPNDGTVAHKLRVSVDAECDGSGGGDPLAAAGLWSGTIKVKVTCD